MIKMTEELKINIEKAQHDVEKRFNKILTNYSDYQTNSLQEVRSLVRFNVRKKNIGLRKTKNFGNSRLVSFSL